MCVENLMGNVQRKKNEITGQKMIPIENSFFYFFFLLSIFLFWHLFIGFRRKIKKKNCWRSHLMLLFCCWDRLRSWEYKGKPCDYDFTNGLTFVSSSAETILNDSSFPLFSFSFYPFSSLFHLKIKTKYKSFLLYDNKTKIRKKIEIEKFYRKTSEERDREKKMKLRPGGGRK